MKGGGKEFDKIQYCDSGAANIMQVVWSIIIFMGLVECLLFVCFSFQFQPFSERIANIDVDVFHRVGHKYEDDSEGSETYFHKALEKWGDLNLTENFEAFRKEIPATHTLPQLLQQKDDVVTVLIKYIKLKNPLSLQPILE